MMKRVLFALALLCAGGSVAGAQSTTTLKPLLASQDWLGAMPSGLELRGKVVLVDVFTFGCYNCQNVVPNLKALHRKGSSDLAIVGIHTPETPYERDRSNVIANLKSQGITWPVAIDNNFALWKSYGVEYWPTQLIFDRKGVLRKTVVGDSQDDEVDKTIAALIKER